MYMSMSISINTTPSHPSLVVDSHWPTLDLTQRPTLPLYGKRIISWPKLVAFTSALDWDERAYEEG